jgi:hypothetical protein
MSCDSHIVTHLNKKKAASRRLIEDRFNQLISNLMSSGSPSHKEIPNYVFGEPPNLLRTPFRYTASTLLPFWQQTYTPTNPSNAAAPYTPSQFTTLTSSTTGIFQYNSAPPPPKNRTKKRPNNENPDTPAPKRARKTGVTAPLLSIAPSEINKNLESGSSSLGLSDSDNHKLSRFFDFLQDDLQWSYGKLLYCTTMGKAPGAIKDKTGKSTNTKVVQRNAAVIQHFMNGNGKYGASQILEDWLKHPYGAHEHESQLMYSVSEPYTNIKPVRPALTSFAAQLVEKKLVKEAESAIKSSSGLRVSISNKKKVAPGSLIKWPDIGSATVENTRKIIREHQPLTWSLIMKVSSRPPRTRNNAKIIQQRRPPESVMLLVTYMKLHRLFSTEFLKQVATGVISTINFSRSSHANLLPLATALLYFGSSASYDLFRYHARMGDMPTEQSVLDTLRPYESVRMITIDMLTEAWLGEYSNGPNSAELSIEPKDTIHMMPPSLVDMTFVPALSLHLKQVKSTLWIHSCGCLEIYQRSKTSFVPIIHSQQRHGTTLQSHRS